MGRHLPHRLLAVGLIIAAAWAPTADGQDNGADTGPCGESTPCTPGQLVGDPNGCGIYHECDTAGSGFVQQTCAEGYQFDFRKLKCKDPESVARIRCSPSCLKLARLEERDSGVETSPSSTPSPSAGEQPSVQTNPTQTTPRVPDPITAVVVPVVAAADTDNATQIAATTTSTTTLSTTSETTSAKMESTQQQTTASTVAKTAPPVVIIPSKTPEPPYVIVTEPRDDVTSGGGGEEGGKDDVTGSPDTGAAGISPIIIGAVIGGVIVIVIIIIIVILLLKRRKFSKGRDIEKMENPQYAASSSNAKYRFSRDSTLFVGPTVNLRQTNNNTSLDTSGMNSVERKKRQAPVAPSQTKKDKLNKRKAPPPPNPFTGEVEDYDRPVTDLYEKDSQGSDENLEMSTFTAQNENTSSPEKDEDKVPGVTDPLLEKGTTGDGPVLGNGQADIKDIDDDDDGSGEDYDKMKNPFFDD